MEDQGHFVGEGILGTGILFNDFKWFYVKQGP